MSAPTILQRGPIKALLISLAEMLVLLTATPTAPADEPKRLDRYGDPLPPGAIARLGTIRRRFDAWTLAWTDEGRTIIACNRERSFRWWDARTGELIKSQEWPGRPWRRVELSPDGKIAATEDSHQDVFSFWDTTTGKCLHSFPHHWTGDFPFLFSADGRFFILARKESLETTLHHFDLTTGKRRLLGKQPFAMALALTSDGKRLASGGPDHEIHCWDVATGRELWKIRQWTASLAFTRDGRHLAFPYQGKLHLLDAASGKEVMQKTLAEDPYQLLSFGPREDTFVLGVRGKNGVDLETVICDQATGKERIRFPASSYKAHFSPDGKTLAGFQGHALQAWDAATGKPLYSDTASWGHTSPAAVVTFSPDGKLLASACGYDYTVRLWDVSTKRLLHTLTDGVALHPVFVAFTPDGKQLMTGDGRRCEFAFWDVTNGTILRRLRLRPKKTVGEPRHVHLSRDGLVLSTLTYIPPEPLAANPAGKSMLTRWDIQTGKPVQNPLSIPIPSAPDSFLSFSPEGRAFLIDEKDVHDFPACHERIARPMNDFLMTQATQQGLIFSPDGALVAASLGRWDQQHLDTDTVHQGIHIWERATGSEVIRLPTKEISQEFFHLAFSPDGRLLAAVGSDQLRVWEVTSGKEVYQQNVKKHLLYEHGCPLVFAPDGCIVAVALRDTTITLWEVPAKRLNAGETTPLSTKRQDELWADLLRSDAAKAYAALGEWIAHPSEAVELFRERIRIVPPLPAETIRRLIDDLDSDEFRRREAASQRLAELGPQADKALQAALAKAPSLEMRKRIETLLSARKDLTPNTLRNLRAVRALEQIGTAQARELLTKLAAEAPNARLAEAAQSALERLRYRR